MALKVLVFLVFLSAACVSSVKPSCRCLPGDACWPSEVAWNDFNSSLGGRLIQVQPPASPCHDPHYDEQACQVVRDNWSRSRWRSDQPGAMQEPNWEAKGNQSCLISTNRSSICYRGAVPPLAVNVTSVLHVQLALKFATKYNIRLVVRNTGHDYLGRSTAPGALSIWLHHLKDITFHSCFQPEECSHGDEVSSTAVTVAAGVQWDELFHQAWEHDRVIVGGGCASVGAAGGYPQGGGHSLLSPAFGLAADNILQYEVVTADGKHRIANRCTNKDLFWALRGGGGGTFGVVVSATHRTHPPFRSVIGASHTFASSNQQSVEKLLLNFTEISPALSDAGWSGYFIPTLQSLTLVFVLPGHSISFANETLSPLLALVQQDDDLQLVSGGLESFSSYEAFRLKVQCGGQQSCVNDSSTSLGPVFYASRLIPRRINTASASSRLLLDSVVGILGMQANVIGIMVAGGEVSKPKNSAVNPAWREALWLLLVIKPFDEKASESEKQAAAKLVTDGNKLLRELTPGSGSYLNEADVNEPDWQFSFFGSNYERLYKIKQRVDPSGLFACRNCVGSENWSQDLNCRVKSSEEP